MEKGELHPNAKLCERDVIAIRQSYGKTIYQLADQFGVSKSLIGAIRNNQIWTHLL
jgi:DNA-binding XRE family transcriptional regulator